MKPSLDSRRWQFKEYNRLFFGGVLHPLLPVHMARMNHYGDFTDACPKYPYGRIRISAKALPECGWRGILLHEMIHAYLEFLDVPDEFAHGPSPWHGPRFVEECNRIGVELGLEPVSEETAWYWPSHVYDDHDPEPA